MATGGAQINVPTPPSALATDAGDSTFNRALQYRTQSGQYSTTLINQISQYLTGLSTNVDETALLAQTGDELVGLGELLGLGQTISSNVNPIIATLLNSVNGIIQNDQPDFDIDGVVDAIVAQLNAELTSSSENVAFFRALIEQIISLALLDSSYQILASDVTDVDNIVNAFIARNQSTTQDEIITIDRKTVNDLITDGVLDSTIAGENLVRMNAKKSRIFEEIQNRAEELRVQQFNIRLQNRIEVMRTKVSAGNIIPDDLLRLNPQLYGLVGDLVKDKFFDMNNFIGAFPGILQTAVSSMTNFGKTSQDERVQKAQVTLGAANEAMKLFQIYGSSLSTIASSAGKLSTFEAV